MNGLGPLAWTLLPRHGMRPLGFRGRLLLHASSRNNDLFAWSEDEVLETAGRGYVVTVRHQASDRTMPLWQHAAACADAAAVHAFLRTHDPGDVLPVGIFVTVACLSGADALLAAVQAAVSRQRAAWQALLVSMFALVIACGPIRPKQEITA
jgi:hypothetical protein